MLDFDRVAGFEWDQGNARKNARHGVSQSEAEQVFFDAELFVAPDAGHSMEESRCHALGSTFADRLLHVTFTLRADMTRIRVISARDMHRKERNIHERQK